MLACPLATVVPLREGKLPRERPEFGIPLLIAEVLSPSTALNDRITNRRRFQASRVGEYWIVDVDGRVIERWRPDAERPEILAERVEWQPRPGIPPLAIDLSEYFREVWGESSPGGPG